MTYFPQFPLIVLDYWLLFVHVVVLISVIFPSLCEVKRKHYWELSGKVFPSTPTNEKSLSGIGSVECPTNWKRRSELNLYFTHSFSHYEICFGEDNSLRNTPLLPLTCLALRGQTPFGPMQENLHYSIAVLCLHTLWLPHINA